MSFVYGLGPNGVLVVRMRIPVIVSFMGNVEHAPSRGLEHPKSAPRMGLLAVFLRRPS